MAHPHHVRARSQFIDLSLLADDPSLQAMPITGCTPMTPDFEAVQPPDYYVNLHTAWHEDGAMRGQFEHDTYDT